jgi:hypothetical protein
MGRAHRSAPREGAGAQPCLSAADATGIADDGVKIGLKEDYAKTQDCTDLRIQTCQTAARRKRHRSAVAQGSVALDRQKAKQAPDASSTSQGMGGKKTQGHCCRSQHVVAIAAKREVRVSARGRSAHRAARQSRLIAAAVARLCKPPSPGRGSRRGATLLHCHVCCMAFHVSGFNHRRDRDREHDPEGSVQARTASLSAVLSTGCLKPAKSVANRMSYTVWDRTAVGSDPILLEPPPSRLTPSNPMDEILQEQLQATPVATHRPQYRGGTR